jgi:hypothetical protein
LGQFDENFSLRAGDEDTGLTGQGQAVEDSGPGEVLQGFVFGPAFDEGAEGVEFGRGEEAFELDVELHAGQLKHMGQEEFDLEPGGRNALLGKIVRRAFEEFEDFQVPLK